MKSPLLFVLISLCLLPCFSHATVMKISFFGEVSSFENNAGAFWDPSTTIGAAVTGHYLLDLEALGDSGRQEASFYWWANISGYSVMTSQINIGNQLFSLTQEGNSRPGEEGWYSDEWIELYNAEPRDEYGDHGDIPDSFLFADNERPGLLPDTDTNKLLAIGFDDFINDIMIVPTGPDYDPDYGPDDLRPFLSNEIVWQDLDFQDSNQSGSGLFRYSLWSRSQTGLNPSIDSDVRFRLHEVSFQKVSNEVPSPNTLWLSILPLIMIAFHTRKPAPLLSGRREHHTMA
ncbi:hypothetical protein [Pseudomaricurvus sp.]|uniref:hypothetical protein n=1 Tax=Pseudomaricurvus sp. TaxID=2004510 RepID=UPI003F6A5D7E